MITVISYNATSISLYVFLLIKLNLYKNYLFAGGIAPRQSKNQSTSANSNIVGSGKATLRLRSQGPATVEMEVRRVYSLSVGKKGSTGLRKSAYYIVMLLFVKQSFALYQPIFLAERNC